MRRILAIIAQKCGDFQVVSYHQKKFRFNINKATLDKDNPFLSHKEQKHYIFCKLRNQ